MASGSLSHGISMGLLSRSLFTRFDHCWRFQRLVRTLSHSLSVRLIAPYTLMSSSAAVRNQQSLRFHCHISSHNVTKCHKISYFLIYRDKIAATFSAICSSNCRASPVNTSNSSLSAPNRSEKSKSSVSRSATPT